MRVKRALWMLLVLTLGGRARAEFIVESHADGNVGGNVASVTSLQFVASITVGGAAIPVTDQGLAVTTTAGATVYFLTQSGVSSSGVATTALSIYAVAPAGDTTAETLTFTDDVDVSLGKPTFRFALQGTISLTPTSGTTLVTLTPPIPPAPLATPDTLLTVSNVVATSPGIGNPSGGGISLTMTATPIVPVPEPASVALMGMGLVVAGLAWRRR